MNEIGQQVSKAGRPGSGDAARAARILDAASKLIAHYGYDKTTVSDIAREARISKGAVYLDFASKEDLFESLLKREVRRYAHRWQELIEADPQGGTLGGMYRATIGALEENPFVTAMMREDAHFFGKYLQRPDNVVRARRHMAMRQELIVLLQQAGVIRQDVDARIVAHVMNTLAYGVIAINQVMDLDDTPTTSETLEGIAAIFDRALAPEQGADSEAGKAVIRRVFEARKKAKAGSPSRGTDGDESARGT